jgi:hypothetical protein
MLVKKHYSNGRLVLAIADQELVNKKFVEKNRQLDLTTSFYKGEKIAKKEIVELVRKDRKSVV